MLQTVLIVIHVLLAIFLIALILVQRGSGATAGAALGAGASATVFGSHGAGSFLTRTTAILAAGFLAISLGMAMLETQQARQAPDESLGVMASHADAQENAGTLPAGDDTTGESSDGPNLIPASQSDIPVPATVPAGKKLKPKSEPNPEAGARPAEEEKKPQSDDDQHGN